MPQIILPEGAAAATPASGRVAIYAKSDGLLYSKDDAGAETALGVSGGGSGSVTSASVVSANGFSGSVATPTTTPAITLSTSVSGVLKGSSGALVAATNADLPAMTATVGGAVPTPPNDASKFLNGAGAFTLPPGGGGGAAWGGITGTLSSQTDLQSALNLKANLASPTFTGTISGITAAMVGLGNINNTSDENKPISTATQTALNAKANTGSANTFTAQQSFTGTTAAAPAIAGASDPNTGAFFPAADTVAVSTGGAERMRIDASGNVLVTNPSGGLGYGPGAGGTVTQATSKSTSVTLNKPCGQITMNAESLAAGATAAFQVTNSLISGPCVVDINPLFDGAIPTSLYQIWVAPAASGAFIVYVKNIHTGALANALVLSFAIIKGSVS